MSAQHLQNLYATKLAEGLSQTTVRHMHMLLHKALHAALRLELVQRNINDLVDPPSMARPEMGVLSPEQARTLLNAASGDRFEALYVLAVTTGMRLGELLALQWDAINLEQSSLQVRSSLYDTGHEFLFTEPKTAKSRRRVHLPQIAVEALRKHRVLLLEERLALGAAWQTEFDLVFPSTVGEPMDPSHIVRREFAKLLKKSGVPRIRFHDLRHTAATLLFAQGINPKVVSEMLGHSDIAITLSLYGHVTPPMQKEAADTMDQIFEQEG